VSEPFQQTIEVADELSEVGRVQEQLSDLWEARSLPPEAGTTVSLALEEVLSNVLRHAKTNGRSSEIRVTFRVDPHGCEFLVSDSAEAFDPLTHPDPDVTLPLEQRRPGGLGVFLVKKLADELSYERRNGRNCLRFVKKF
jgi:serine/threonine-protein kinase RsbW